MTKRGGGGFGGYTEHEILSGGGLVCMLAPLNV